MKLKTLGVLTLVLGWSSNVFALSWYCNDQENNVWSFRTTTRTGGYISAFSPQTGQNIRGRFYNLSVPWGWNIAAGASGYRCDMVDNGPGREYVCIKNYGPDTAEPVLALQNCTVTSR